MCSPNDVLTLQQLLFEQRAQMAALTSNLDEMKSAQDKALEAQIFSQTAYATLSKEHLQLQQEHAQLRNEVEALRECLLMCGALEPQVLKKRVSMRRAPEVFQTVLENRDLALTLGLLMGPSSAARFCRTSRSHGGAMASCKTHLLHQVPPDIYVIGGKNDQAVALSSVERYNPRLATWTRVPPMRKRRYGCAAATFQGKIYVTGGNDGAEMLASTERFDPVSNSWESLAPLNHARSRATAVALATKLFVIGGKAPAAVSPHVALVECFDPRSERWEVLPPIPLGGSGCSATAVNGKLFVVGVDASLKMVVGQFDPVRKDWSTIPNVPMHRFGCAVAGLQGGLFVLGGHDGQHAVACAERLTVDSVGPTEAGKKKEEEDPQWELLPSVPTPRHGCASAAADGALYLLGGDSQTSMFSAERYDLELGAWMKLPKLPTARFGCAAAAAFR